MRLRLTELQVDDKQAKEVKVEIKEGQKDIDKVLYFQSLLYIFEMICIELIGWYYYDLLVD